MIQILSLPTSNQHPIIRGDSWGGLNATISINLIPVDLTGASIRIHLYHNCGSKIELSTGGNGITITDAVNGVFQINSISRLDWKVGKHVGDVEVTYQNNNRITYMQLHINVTDDITK